MPRIADPANEKQRLRQERYRKKLKEVGDPEIGLVDTALVNALTIYYEQARKAKNTKSLNRITALEQIAVNFLMSKEKSKKEAEKRVKRRLSRLEVDDLIEQVNAAYAKSKQIS
jgi:uncharacterized protein YktB (UPF0637 family)